MLPTDIVFFILNMCSWNWFGGEEEIKSVGFGSNGADDYEQEEHGGDGIGWQLGMYRTLIAEHMQSSQTGQAVFRQLMMGFDDELSGSDDTDEGNDVGMDDVPSATRAGGEDEEDSSDDPDWTGEEYAEEYAALDEDDESDEDGSEDGMANGEDGRDSDANGEVDGMDEDDAAAAGGGAAGGGSCGKNSGAN
jgi:hypothetical protein